MKQTAMRNKNWKKMNKVINKRGTMKQENISLYMKQDIQRND